MQTLATALLCAALAGLALSHAMGGAGAWGWLRAGCEAAAVGALADWFAVVALFRRPLGLPIPHTALIPNSKARIADNLAIFVRDNFLDPKTLRAKLEVIDPAARLAEWLSDKQRVNGWAQTSRAVAADALDLVDDDTVRQALQHTLMEHASRWDAAKTAGDVLGLLSKDGRHHELLDSALAQMGHWVSQDQVKTKLATFLLAKVRQQYPKIAGTVGMFTNLDELSADIVDKMVDEGLVELRDLLSDPVHPARLQYEAWLQNYIDRLHTDSALRQSVAHIKQQLLDHPAVRQFVGSLWDDVKQLLKADLANPQSKLAQLLENALLGLGSKLATDAPLREALNRHIFHAADQLLASQLRSHVTQHIANTVKAWDDQQLVQQLELNVGKDLQFIRINGTVVGAVAGLAIHAVAAFAA
jgi:uncharacterized membrane-anchored protein YjiN (DUF445 family)